MRWRPRITPSPSDSPRTRAGGKRSASALGNKASIVEVEPKPNKGVISGVLDVVEKSVLQFLFHGRTGESDDVKKKKNRHRNLYLTGNFAPVGEETPPCSDLSVKGVIPECLNGEFAMVGPNPKFRPAGRYHWLDGDGMIHGLRIKNGKATYASRYVRTSRLKQEELFGEAKFVKLGDMKGFLGYFMAAMDALRKTFKVLDFSYGMYTANTAMVYHNRKVLVLHEQDKPYVIKVTEDGDLQTIGIYDYDKQLNHPFTAHPKIDPLTDELFIFGYSTNPPYLTYRIITKDGAMLEPVHISISRPIMMHDFGITENYAIFMDLPMIFEPQNMSKGNMIISFENTRKARFGLLPRYAEDELSIRWFELPSCFVCHVANAWEEGNQVVMICCRYPSLDLDLIGEGLKEPFDLHVELFEMRFDLETGAASQKQLSIPTVEFPLINKRYVGRKPRYVYASILKKMESVGLVKFDLLAEPETGKKNLEVGGNITGIFKLGPGKYGSEPKFIPRSQWSNSLEEEDDGYLIFFVYDEKSGKSEVNIIDAKTMSDVPVAVVELPVRVPYGLHSIFVTEEELQSQ